MRTAAAGCQSVLLGRAWTTAVLIIAFLWVLAFAASAAPGLSDRELGEITFDQKLNNQVSLSLAFRDEAGRQVKLGQYFGKKPVILVLGYYECPMLCTLVVNGMVEALEDLKWTIGDQFEVVNISINPREGPALAAAKKATYLKRYGRTGAAAGWHFLVGDQRSIRQIAEEVGFHFQYDPQSGQYAHPSGVVFLTPQGKVARYQFGVAFKPAELLRSLQQAQSGQPGSPIQRLVLLCFHYNPITGKYGAAIMAVIRILSLATVAGLCWLLWRLARRDKREPAPAVATSPPVGRPAP